MRFCSPNRGRAQGSCQGPEGLGGLARSHSQVEVMGGLSLEDFRQNTYVYCSRPVGWIWRASTTVIGGSRSRRVCTNLECIKYPVRATGKTRAAWPWAAVGEGVQE